RGSHQPPQEQPPAPRVAPMTPSQQATFKNQPNIYAPPTVPQGQYNAPGARPAQTQSQYAQPGQPGYGQPAAPVPGQATLPPRKTARRRKILGCSPGCFMVFVGVFVTFCGGLSLITLVLSATLGARLEEQLQTQVASIDDYRNFQSTFFYDRTG